MGELHLEITNYRIANEHKVEIKTSQPIVVFRECVGGKGGPFEGKSPNKHNRFYVEVEPLDSKIVDAIRSGEIETEGRIKDAKALARKLQDLGFSKEEGKGVVAFNGSNMLMDMTKGIQYLHETMELIKDAFDEAMNQGPLANEKCMAMKVMLVDAKLHEDSIHRGPAQVIPAARSAIYGAMCQAGRVLYEPIQKVFINVPEDMMGNAIREIQQRRGIIEDMKQEGDIATVQGKCPVAEMFGFAASIRSATSGRALWSTENTGFEQMPREVVEKTVPQIRQRKGLKPEPYDASYYAG
jgi:elongation factor 2